ncbi:hypothetical protein [Streptomyces californicus]|uniref:hypothetical protein n=1 Tax=Streptomyces californicus TaxID=67351 RepID=UPI003320DA80
MDDLQRGGDRFGCGQYVGGGHAGTAQWAGEAEVDLGFDAWGAVPGGAYRAAVAVDHVVQQMPEVRLVHSEELLHRG